ncbi:MAG: hypothetical protein HY079_11855 [Elusimicrobia bacterium]|nr:hypothetical protein [Elusimicrobiota bacterium]
MKQRLLLSAVLAGLLAAPSAAQPAAEAVWASGAARFEASLAMSGVKFRPALSAGAPAATSAEREAFLKALDGSATLLRASGFAAAGPTLSADLELASLLDRHLKTRLHYVLNGRHVWFSGAFDRNQKPFVSVLVDGQPVRYFDVKALLNEDQRVSVGGMPFTLSLSANIFHRMKSTIKLASDSTGQNARFSVQDMLDAVAVAGSPVRFSDQTTQFYYSNGIDGVRMFVFIFGDAKDFHVYLVPESLVPSDKLAVFKMFGDKRVGLTRQDGRLRIYENP